LQLLQKTKNEIIEEAKNNGKIKTYISQIN
jgi:hypothetical protein